ncbi:superinfection immunity protein [Flexivirga meconopsidis]|uniref:superinfection immunity protein n=1 Tax=Flexivirga meconopsidis TaxID=2977121 RepID=UPI00223FFC58|nr:superinfection immunity protein [Flexivirga meconopsidis]
MSYDEPHPTQAHAPVAPTQHLPQQPPKQHEPYPQPYPPHAVAPYNGPQQQQGWPQQQYPPPAYLPAPMVSTARPPVSTGLVVFAWILAVITFFYLLPWAVAVTRNRSNMGAIFLLNFLLGWSFIGWVVSLVMACGADQQTNVLVVNQAPYGPPPR